NLTTIHYALLMNENLPCVVEDVLQMRDFVSVHDIVQATLLAMENRAADGRALNVGSGHPVTIAEIAAELSAALGRPPLMEITDKYRAGDIRYCIGAISAIADLLGYRPRVRLKQV